jgi:hypothetical protein
MKDLKPNQQLSKIQQQGTPVNPVKTPRCRQETNWNHLLNSENFFRGDYLLDKL